MLLSKSMLDLGTSGHPVTDTSATGASSIPPHPLGLKPLGNKYFAGGNDARECIGALRALPDEMLILLVEYLDCRSLRRLGYACRFLYALSLSDDLWKSIFLE